MCVCVCLQLGLSVEGLGIWRYSCVAAVLRCANVLAQASGSNVKLQVCWCVRVSVWVAMSGVILKVHPLVLPLQLGQQQALCETETGHGAYPDYPQICEQDK